MPKVTQLGDSTARISTQVLLISQSSLDQPGEKIKNRGGMGRGGEGKRVEERRGEERRGEERLALFPWDRRKTEGEREGRGCTETVNQRGRKVRKLI